MTPLQHAEHMRDQAAKAGRFWVGLADLLETMANRWEEFSQEQFDREVEALKASEQAAACRAEWSRWNRRVKSLQAPHGSEREAA